MRAKYLSPLRSPAVNSRFLRERRMTRLAAARPRTVLPALIPGLACGAGAAASGPSKAPGVPLPISARFFRGTVRTKPGPGPPVVRMGRSQHKMRRMSKGRKSIFIDFSEMLCGRTSNCRYCAEQYCLPFVRGEQESPVPFVNPNICRAAGQHIVRISFRKRMSDRSFLVG
jgi:hypothetical protein